MKRFIQKKKRSMGMILYQVQREGPQGSSPHKLVILSYSIGGIYIRNELGTKMKGHEIATNYK